MKRIAEHDDARRLARKSQQQQRQAIVGVVMHALTADMAREEHVQAVARCKCKSVFGCPAIGSQFPGEL